MKPKTLHTYENKDDGIQSEVITHVKGFIVVVRDTDADMVFPMMIIYPTEDRAIIAAKKAANLNA